MPGMYQRGEYDLAGTIVGVVDRAKALDGSKIKAGDVIIGLASNGLHTNGYSLARKVLFEQMGLKLASRSCPASRRPLGDELLRVHRNYQPLLAKLPARHGQRPRAHHRRRPRRQSPARPAEDLRRRDRHASRGKCPRFSSTSRDGGKVDHAEMYQVFNMGIGMTVIVSAADRAKALKLTKGRVIGRIEKGSGVVRLEF